MAATLTHRTVSELVAQRLRAEITSGERAPGERLRQVELARRYDVSTTPVREALAMLQREGLVRLHPQRGAVVFRPTLEDLREHYEIRAELEALAAGHAAAAFRDEWAPPLTALVDAMAAGPPAPEYLTLNRRFHGELYRHSGRRQLVELIDRLRDASSAYLHIAHATPDFPAADTDAEHRAMLAACVARDRDAAARATRRHLAHTVDRVAEELST